MAMTMTILPPSCLAPSTRIRTRRSDPEDPETREAAKGRKIPEYQRSHLPNYLPYLQDAAGTWKPDLGRFRSGRLDSSIAKHSSAFTSTTSFYIQVSGRRLPEARMRVSIISSSHARPRYARLHSRCMYFCTRYHVPSPYSHVIPMLFASLQLPYTPSSRQPPQACQVASLDDILVPPETASPILPTVTIITSGSRVPQSQTSAENTPPLVRDRDSQRKTTRRVGNCQLDS